MGMYRELLDHAEDHLDRSIEYLGLYVDPRNPAVYFWQKKCDFTIMPDRTYTDATERIREC